MSDKVTRLPAIRCGYCNVDQVYKVVGKPEIACGRCHRSLCVWCEQCSKPFRDGERWTIIGDIVITDLKLNTKVVKARLVCKECSMNHSKAFDAQWYKTTYLGNCRCQLVSDEPKPDVPNLEWSKYQCVQTRFSDRWVDTVFRHHDGSMNNSPYTTDRDQWWVAADAFIAKASSHADGVELNIIGTPDKWAKVVITIMPVDKTSDPPAANVDAKPSDESKQDVPRGFVMCSQCADVQWYEGSALPGAFLCEACLKADGARRIAMREVKPDLAAFETMGQKIAADVERATLGAIVTETPAGPTAEPPQPVMWVKCSLCPYLTKWDGVMSADNFVCNTCKGYYWPEMPMQVKAINDARTAGADESLLPKVWQDWVHHKLHAAPLMPIGYTATCTKCKSERVLPDPVDALTWLCDECKAEVSVVNVPFEPTKDPISFQALTPVMAVVDKPAIGDILPNGMVHLGDGVDPVPIAMVGVDPVPTEMIQDTPADAVPKEPTYETWRDRPPLL